MNPLPQLALSVRQPWAWAIIHAGKDIENRTAYALRYFEPLTGRRAVHASKGLTRAEYEHARTFMASIGVSCPPPGELVRGAIIGCVDVTGCVARSASAWFVGPRGLLLANPRACVPVPAAGELGYFRWRAAAAASMPDPAQWMLPNDRTGDLFK